MWYSKPKQQAVSVDEYINRFTIRHAACDSTKVIEVDNIRFTMKAYYGYSVKIHLVDGEDELLVYDADYSGVKRGTWHHKGSWCDKILQIVLDDCEKYERIVRAKEKAIEDELSRLKDKFGKLFSGDKDAAKV